MKFSQRGNAIVYILIAVALFGALTYVFIKGAKTGQGNLTTQQSKMLGDELVSYSNTIARAVDRVRNKGCSENQINFVASGNTGYANGTAPSDNSCDIFHASGGAVTTWQTFSTLLGTPYIIGTHTIHGSLSASGDLLFVYDNVPSSACTAINRQLGIDISSASSDATAITYTKFIGAFANGAAPNDVDAKVQNKLSACVYMSDGAMLKNIYYRVLLDR